MTDLISYEAILPLTTYPLYSWFTTKQCAMYRTLSARTVAFYNYIFPKIEFGCGADLYSVSCA